MLAYTGTPGVNAANFDLTAAVDPEISTRNGHYIFSEDYDLLAAYYFELNALRGSFLLPLWNNFTRMNIWPPNRSATNPSNPQLDWWLLRHPRFSRNEELQLQVSNNLGAATEQAAVFLWIAPRGKWDQNLPQPMQDALDVPIIEIRSFFTTPSITANTWSGLGAITLEQGLRSGTYALVGVMGQGTGIEAGRMVFPRGPIFMNRRMRPGFLMSQTMGDIPLQFTPYGPFAFGEYGRFNTFELPQIEWWSTAGGAIAVELRLYLVRLTDSMDVKYAA